MNILTELSGHLHEECFLKVEGLSFLFLPVLRVAGSPLRKGLYSKGKK